MNQHRSDPERAGAVAHARAAAVAALGAALVACSGGGGHVEQRLYSMGTWVDVAIDAAADEQAAAALDDVESMLRRFEVDYYAWADGELARLNDGLRRGATVTVSESLAALLREAQRLSALSGGSFDPAVGELVELWRFHSAPEPAVDAPSPEAVEDWRRAAASIDALAIEGRQVRSSRRRIKLDLGGIAKGEAVDRAIELLRRHGIRNALVNAGGDLRVIGTNGGRPWRVGIKSPRGDGIIGVIELADGEAAFTSGDYERYYERDGKRMHHILDPRTGYPAGETQAFTVVGDSGVRADAAATALFVSGDGWPVVARSLGVACALRVDASGEIEATGEMISRLGKAGAEHADVVFVES